MDCLGVRALSGTPHGLADEEAEQLLLSLAIALDLGRVVRKSALDGRRECVLRANRGQPLGLDDRRRRPALEDERLHRLRRRVLRERPGLDHVQQVCERGRVRLRGREGRPVEGAAQVVDHQRTSGLSIGAGLEDGLRQGAQVVVGGEHRGLLLSDPVLDEPVVYRTLVVVQTRGRVVGASFRPRGRGLRRRGRGLRRGRLGPAVAQGDDPVEDRRAGQ